MDPVTPRVAALWIASLFIGKPYMWGGDDPTGFDCSGIVVEVLKASGRVPRGFDASAAGLFDRYKEHAVSPPFRPGTLVFFRNEQHQISHVEIIFDTLSDGTVRTLAAAGGGPHVRTLEDAKKYNAFIQVRPLRTDWSDAVDPFEGTDK